MTKSIALSSLQLIHNEKEKFIMPSSLSAASQPVPYLIIFLIYLAKDQSKDWQN